MIKDLDDNKLFDYIRGWGLTVGISYEIDEAIEKRVLIDFLRSFYSHFPANEITLAFKLYAAQKLTFKDAVYNNMNPTFIGKVLSAYVEYRREKKLLLKSSDNVKLLAEPKEEINEGQKAFEFIEKNKENLAGPFFIANWKAAFFHAKESGILKLDGKKVDFLREKVNIGVAKERNKCKLNGRDPKYLSESSYLRNEYFRAALMDHFKSN